MPFTGVSYAHLPVSRFRVLLCCNRPAGRISTGLVALGHRVRVIALPCRTAKCTVDVCI
jgi:hypothetical protein